ncbi:sce7726 family protein [Butyrivibrio sp. NC3005]|uniref:sce7726 family protein n=1 Tax=Butyrivibrio sp. NC3005 TaxID=1280685 RepID=UPI000401FCE7|nr:sce7726 family protein [Butyrivibrio sp. NC3005]
MLLDKDIRKPLGLFLQHEYGKIKIIEEKMIGNSRADLLVITSNALIGVEIKSDADTYARLSSQTEDYDTIFDYNIVAVGSSHAFHIEEHVPKHWGIITIDEIEEGVDFYFLRKPAKNDKALIERKLELLWRPEFNVVLQNHNMPKYSSSSKPFLIKKIIEWTKLPLPKTEIKRLEQLKQTDDSIKVPQTRIDIEKLSPEICSILLNRNEEKILKEIKEYRKSKNPRRRGRKRNTNIKSIRRRAKK